MHTKTTISATFLALSSVVRSIPQIATTSTATSFSGSLTTASITTGVSITSSAATNPTAPATSSASAAPTGVIAPFRPAGGLGTNNSVIPVYAPLSDFDFQSMNLALNQEWIELDLFHNGLAKFSDAEFEAAGLDAQDRFLIEWMADQEVDHAIMLSNILGPNAAKPCNYSYPFTTVQEFIDFSQKLTRFGESGVYGFLEHLDSRPSATLLLQSITTEARQQMIFRQFEGLFPMPISFIPGITQSMAWTLLSPYITSCPEDNPRIVWQNFPALNITNNPSPIPIGNSTDTTAPTSIETATSSVSSGLTVTLTASTSAITSTETSSISVLIPSDVIPSFTSLFTSLLTSLLTPVPTESGPSLSASSASATASGAAEFNPPAITNNRTVPLSTPGREVQLAWEAPGKVTGYNGLYMTNTSAGEPKFVAWISSLNTTYTPLENIQNSTNSSGSTGTTIQPDAGLVFTNGSAAAINGTLFIAITDTDLFVTPFNLSALNDHIVAGPAMYQSG